MSSVQLNTGPPTPTNQVLKHPQTARIGSAERPDSPPPGLYRIGSTFGCSVLGAVSSLSRICIQSLSNLPLFYPLLTNLPLSFFLIPLPLPLIPSPFPLLRFRNFLMDRGVEMTLLFLACFIWGMGVMLLALSTRPGSGPPFRENMGIGDCSRIS